MCIEIKAVEVSDIEHGPGWTISGPFTEYVRKVWPGTRTNKGGGKSATGFLRNFLRETGNVVVRQDGQIFVRKTWQSMETVILWRERNREQRRKEAKVTPHEAGEDREPGPVTVSQEQPVMTRGFYHYYASGRVVCWRCGQTMKSARSTGGHAKRHYREDLADRVTELEQTVHTNGNEISFEVGLTAVRDQHRAIILKLQESQDEVDRLRKELDERPEQTEGDDGARISLIREALAKYQSGGLSPLRLISDIYDVVADEESS
jgi:hypothetical protein